jgi:hypothetical protein
MEMIEKELLLLKLRRADLHRRIRALRHAVIALIKVFGPVILDLETHSAVHLPNVPYRGRAPINVCREILRESPHPLSSDRILDLVRHTAPGMLAEFQNPGVAISNALRTLERRGEVEHWKSGEWRWKQKQERRSGPDRRPHPWSPESQSSEGQFFGHEE